MVSEYYRLYCIIKVPVIDNSYKINKRNACGCQCLAVEYLIEDKKLKKGHNSGKKKKKMHFELSHLIVWTALWKGHNSGKKKKKCILNCLT